MCFELNSEAGGRENRCLFMASKINNNDDSNQKTQQESPREFFSGLGLVDHHPEKIY